MSLDTTNYATRCGASFTVVATDLPGNFPHIIISDGLTLRLRTDLTCADDSDYDLVPNTREMVRYFNIYRAADGGFVFGSKAWATDYDRREAHDSQRAISAVRVTMDADNNITAFEQV